MTSGNGERLVFDRPLLGKGESVLKSAPEQPAVDAVAAVIVDTAAFGTVPGGAEAANRMRQWADRSKTQMARATQDVADLGRRTGMAKAMVDQMEGETTALARSATPSGPS